MRILDGVTGNDPASPPWQRGALPLCYTPKNFLVAREGIEPSPTRFKGGAPIPIQSAGQWWELEELNLSSLTAALVLGQRFYKPPSGPAPREFGGSGGLCSRCLLLAKQALS